MPRVTPGLGMLSASAGHPEPSAGRALPQLGFQVDTSLGRAPGEPSHTLPLSVGAICGKPLLSQGQGRHVGQGLRAV